MALNFYAASVVEGTFLFPAISGGCVVLGAVSGVVLFGDRLNKKQLLSIMSGVIAIVLMNF